MKNARHTGNQKSRLLEVIVTSVEDAIAAEQGGAERLEVISNFAVGGLSPAIELVKDIQNATSIPLRVMLRVNEGFELSNQQEYETLCQSAKAFAALDVDGLVLGFLRQGELDVTSVNGILSCAPNLKATFHRAFEILNDPFQTLESLKQLQQVDRILTSGSGGTWQQNIEFLNALQTSADPELTILVGGGLDLHKIESLCATTGLREFHVGKAVRQLEQIDGLVCADKVKAMVQLFE